MRQSKELVQLTIRKKLAFFGNFWPKHFIQSTGLFVTNVYTNIYSRKGRLRRPFARPSGVGGIIVYGTDIQTDTHMGQTYRQTHTHMGQTYRQTHTLMGQTYRQTHLWDRHTDRHTYGTDIQTDTYGL